MSAWRAAQLPEADDTLDLAKRETNGLGRSDETQPIQGGWGVVAVTGLGAVRCREQAHPLVVPQCLSRESGLVRNLPDPHIETIPLDLPP